MTHIQVQNYQILLHPKQGYSNAKTERPPLNSVCKKDNVNLFVKSENKSIRTLLNAQMCISDALQSKIMHYNHS